MRSAGASPLVRAILTNSTLVELNAGEAVIACPPRFAGGARQRIAEISGVFEKEVGRKIEVRVQDVGGEGAAADGVGAEAGAGASMGQASPVDDPLVKLAAELFGARIVAVTQRPTGTA